VTRPPLSELRGEVWKQTLAAGDRITTARRDLDACTVVGWDLDSYQFVWYLEVEPDGAAKTEWLREHEIVALLSKAVLATDPVVERSVRVVDVFCSRCGKNA
jgi:hypothetical protein